MMKVIAITRNIRGIGYVLVEYFLSKGIVF